MAGDRIDDQRRQLDALRIGRGRGQHYIRVAPAEGGVVLEGDIPAQCFGALDVGSESRDGAVVKAIEAKLGNCHHASIGRQAFCHNVV